MARVKGIVEYYESVDTASFTPPLPDHVAGDTLLIFVSKDHATGNAPSTASSGWTVGGGGVSPGATTAACWAGWFYNYCDSSDESITITDSDADSWTVVSICIEGAHSTPVDASDTNGQQETAAQAEAFSTGAQITTNFDDSLVFFAICTSQGNAAPFPGVRTISATDQNTDSVAVGMKVQKSAGGTGTWKFYPATHASDNARTFTVAIRDSGSLTYMPAYVNTDFANLLSGLRGTAVSLRGEAWSAAVTNTPHVGDADSKATYQYDDSTTTFYDVTTAANNTTASDWTLLNNSPAPAANDYTAWCLDWPYIGFRVLYTTAAVGGTRVWEYYNGASWATLTVTDGSTSFTAAAATVYYITMTIAQLKPISGRWKTTTLNGTTGYWLRCRWSTAPTTNPTMSYMRPIQGSTTVTAVGVTADSGANPLHDSSLHAGVQAVQGEWRGTYLTMGTDVTGVSLANTFLVGTWAYSTPRDYVDMSNRKELGGLTVAVYDGSWNYRSYIVGAYKALDTVPDDRNCFVIQWSGASKTYPNPKLTDPTTAVSVGMYSHSMRGAAAVRASQLVLLTTPKLSGGTSTNPINKTEFVNTFAIDYFYPLPLIRNGVCRIPIQIGGADAVHLNLDLFNLAFPTRTTEPDAFSDTPYCASHVDLETLGLILDARSGDTCKITNSVLTSPSAWKFEILGTASSGATWDFSGTSIINAKVILKNVMTFTNISFTSPTTIDATGCNLDECTFSTLAAGNDTLTTSSSTLIENSEITTTGITAGNRWTSVATADLDIFSGNAFTGSHTSGHAIRIASGSGSVSFSGNTFTSYGPTVFGFHTTNDITEGTDDWITKADHGYTTGDPIRYMKQGGSAVTGLSDDTTYYVRAVTSSTIAFYTSSANAIADTGRISLSKAGSETHYINSLGAAIYNDSGGAVTISITNGGSIPTIRNGASATTTVNNTKTITVTVKDSNNVAVASAQVWIQKIPSDTDYGHEAKPFTSAAGNNAADADFVVSETPPSDLPSSGWINVTSSGRLQSYRYASKSGSTFTLRTGVTGTDNGSGTTTTISETGISAKDIVEGDTIRMTASPKEWAIVLSNTGDVVTTTATSGGTSWAGKAYGVHTLAMTYQQTTDKATVPLMNEETNGSGVATEGYNYSASKDVIIRVRKASSGTKYLPYSSTGTITGDFSLAVTLTTDTIA